MRYLDLSNDSRELIGKLNYGQSGIKPYVSFAIAAALAYRLPLPDNIGNRKDDSELMNYYKLNCTIKNAEILNSLMEHASIDYKEILSLAPAIFTLRFRLAYEARKLSFTLSVPENNQLIPTFYTKVLDENAYKIDEIIFLFEKYVENFCLKGQEGINSNVKVSQPLEPVIGTI